MDKKTKKAVENFSDDSDDSQSSVELNKQIQGKRGRVASDASAGKGKKAAPSKKQVANPSSDDSDSDVDNV